MTVPPGLWATLYPQGTAPFVEDVATTELVHEIRELRAALERRERAELLAEYSTLTQAWDRGRR